VLPVERKKRKKEKMKKIGFFAFNTPSLPMSVHKKFQPIRTSQREEDI